ncbi:MAG: hypothetical protein VX438_00125 [Planctomycetota bacterium]|nr:hypothetical protein [Planctomycetota bacterium]
MQKSPLFKLIHRVRQHLVENPQFGQLISEKFLLIDGELAGQQFCFENAQANWRFNSKFAEIVMENRVQNIEVIRGIESKTAVVVQQPHGLPKAA